MFTCVVFTCVVFTCVVVRRWWGRRCCVCCCLYRSALLYESDCDYTVNQSTGLLLTMLTTLSVVIIYNNRPLQEINFLRFTVYSEPYPV